MMMRDKKTGRVFPSEKKAVEWFCHGQCGCEGCSMNEVSPERLCRHNAWERPFEAAKAMGMEVVRYRLTDEERRLLQAASASYVARDESAGWVELWFRKPHKFKRPLIGSSFPYGFVGEAIIGGLTAVLFPSLNLGECVGVDDLVVVSEDGEDVEENG